MRSSRRNVIKIERESGKKSTRKHPFYLPRRKKTKTTDPLVLMRRENEGASPPFQMPRTSSIKATVDDDQKQRVKKTGTPQHHFLLHDCAYMCENSNLHVFAYFFLFLPPSDGPPLFQQSTIPVFPLMLKPRPPLPPGAQSLVWCGNCVLPSPPLAVS